MKEDQPVKPTDLKITLFFTFARKPAFFTGIRSAVSDGLGVRISVGRMKDGSVDGDRSVGGQLSGGVVLVDVRQPGRLSHRIRHRSRASGAVL